MARYSNTSQDSQSPLLVDSVQKSPRRRTRLIWSLSALAVFGLTCIYLTHSLPSAPIEGIHSQAFWSDSAAAKVVAPGISLKSFNHGLSKCQSILERQHKETNTSRVRHRNPRAVSKEKLLLIKNGQIWLNDRYLHGDILIEDGLITAVDKDIDVPDARVIDAKGRIVTPGIVDMHSHMAGSSFPGLRASDDINEMTHPTTPYVRVIDAISPSDPGLKIVASGGVTTSLILPGSGNLMGGEAAVIKLRPVPTLSNQDMLIGAGVEDEDEEIVWRYMKMACGENPKTYYGGYLNRAPMTRMGENYLFRKRFEEAQALMRAQDDWCDAATRVNATFPTDKPIDETTITRLTERFPELIDLESLVALLRHEVLLNIHCYLPQDIEAMISHSLEFDFEIAGLHHALAAWKVPEVIKRAKTNITIATFADMWGYKAEAWEQNVHAPSILADAGIPVAFKSDHPVMNARDLMHEAQKAFHYGFDEHLALAAVTSVPAKALKLDHRIGRIAPGMDADIVIWERHPLRLGARPQKVIIDGAEMNFKASWAKSVEEDQDSTWVDTLADTVDVADKKEEKKGWLPPFSTSTMKLEDHGLNNPIKFDEACGPNVNSFVMRNIGRLYMGPDETYDSTMAKERIGLVVKDGVIICAGIECDREHVEWPKSSPVFEMGGAVIIPGIFSAGESLGLIEIQAESSTQDGIAKNDVSDPKLAQTVVRAADGIKLNGLHLQKAFKAGVTTSISQPLVESAGLAGVSVSFRTGTERTVLDTNDTIINDETALHFVVGTSGSTTVSQQIAAIRDLLTTNVNKDASTNVFARAAQGKLPVVIQTNDKDEIASIVQMKKQLYDQSKQQFSVKFIILGGAEAHLVADHLKRLDIPVILSPARCFPGDWSSRLCLSGPPLTPFTGLDILIDRQVRVGLASTDVNNGDARNLIWEAGWNLAHNGKLDESQAVGLVTWNIADIFGLGSKDIGTIQVGHKADFVAYNSNPFEFGSRVLMVYGGGHSGPECFPKQI
ncbi:hypothetical protein J3Q64DRAFT_1202866 [Phycomyces blakesleeanus]|uniref:Amidohydrolase-related domain-containing protein n=2 Tax=Phycomyces blakesleeanus TaxID=4837 RepID=A0ABR3ARQ9_PHYBL